MAKFKISLEITGFKLNIEGNREDVPLMTQAVGQQFAGLLGPASDIIEGEIVDHGSAVTPIPEPKTEKKPSRRRSQTSTTVRTNNPEKKDEAIDWRHDPSKWGNPQVEWVTADKAMWLLYVVSQESDTKELASRTIEITFNKHFKQSKPIQVGNINRDLGRLKNKTPFLVSQDTTKEPPTWYLTDLGVKHTQELITKVRSAGNES